MRAQGRKLGSVTVTVDLNQFSNSIPKAYIVPETELRYGEALQYFDRYRELHPDATVPPNYQTFKSFLVWASLLKEGRIEDSPLGNNPDGTPRILPCVDTMKSFLRRFIAAWSRTDRPEIPRRVATAMKDYVQGDMIIQAPLSTAEMPKPCLAPNDLAALLKHLWCNDSYNYRGKCADRQRVALSFATLVYCFTSARTGEVHESTARRKASRSQCQSGGVEEHNLIFSAKAMAACYKHFELSVEVVEGEVMIVLSYKRLFVKGFRKRKAWELPLHVFYETYVLDQPLMFNPILFFLPMAAADHVFMGYTSAIDILDAADKAAEAYGSGNVNDSHVLFKYAMRQDIAEFPVLRPFTELKIEDATGRARGADSFAKQFAELGHRAGYPDRITARACRRWALMEADRNGSENARMKLAGHLDRRQFSKAYAHPLSDIDGQASYLGTRDRRGHITNRRGMELQKHQVVWESLPAKLEFEFEERNDVAAIQKEMQNLDEELKSSVAMDAVREIELEKRRLQYRKRSLYDQELQRFHRTNPDMTNSEACLPFHYTRRVMPDRDLLAELLPRLGKLRSDDGRKAVQALENLCVTDTTICYRRGIHPLDGDQCGSCGTCIEDLFAHRRWYHLYRCYQSKLSKMGNDEFADFCFECDLWINNKLEWDQHCQHHLDTPETLVRCDPIIFRNALVKAGYCPFCLGDNDQDANSRVRQFIDKSKWHDHIESHLESLTVDFTCCHPACSMNCDSLSDLVQHLWDRHYFRRLRGRKRKVEEL
ncbi:conserved hypothetical protein [Talaromyces stipitatus ATCC 10500]|uniref:Uncharacterized protein n=1 Tax=Talaromyces stipitatus (strain ATCC 10500 / CBS 375.48 / QM 6759 / NRRL 1006) TaxID=441959 RepID=B8M0A5_TALSN|nr:uncharacterized protein TSTA_084330 [Talaromyces stipitatus ATCC 10500]EED21202.1 conserved hypothetical protein [Talaromyces stipitatus ATCC 10500]